MLERTATSIEPCSSSLQRVLPTARSCLQSRRKLHTAFWRHGAAEFELIDACQALMRQGPAESKMHTTPANHNKRPETMTASGFLLDFLYPSGTAALFRRPYPIHPVRLESGSRTRGPMSRLFTSAVPQRSGQPPDRQLADEEFAGLGEAEEEGVGEEEEYAHEVAMENAEEEDDAWGANADKLRRLLWSDHAGAYDQIFQLYTTLTPSLKQAYMTDVLLAIAASTRPIEAWRVVDLFSNYQVDEWTEELVRGAVKAQLTLHKVPEAMAIFRTAMEQRGFGGALDYIAAYGFELSSWDMVLDAWGLYFRINGEKEPVFEPLPLETAEPSAKPTEVENLKEEQATQAVTEPSEAEPSPDKAPVDKGHSYPALAATTNFEAKVRELYKYLENDPESLPELTALVDSFLRHLIRHSLDLFRPSDVVFMLDRAKDPHTYERYIIINAEQGRKRLAGDLYRKYRSLPDALVASSVLRAMIDVFFPHNVAGMEQLLEDWYRCHGHLDERAYHKFMAFYGGRGDIKSIMRLAGEYAKHYDSKVEEDPKFVTTLMNAHAVRGDPDAAQRVMDEAADKSGEPPEIKQWNILMNAYTKAGDYGGAIDLFSYICNELEPDDYTFATMMGMAGFRGDLQFTLELFELARERNVQPTIAMMRALVEAYCQNDRFTEAEKLCVRVTRQRDIPGDITFLWNALLRHNAKRRDLTTVNRLLEFMSSQGIAYNQETYSQLLLALLYARQSHHAMHLLRVANREGPDHFVLLMAAFINSGEPHMALKTNELMAKMNYPQSAMRMTKVIDALGRWQQLPSSKRRGLSGDHFLKKILRDFYKAMEREDQGSPDDIRSVIGLYSKVLFILTQMREHVTVQQIIQLHNTRYPARASNETIPLKLLHQIMLADFFEKKFDRVRETWDLILRRASKRYQPASSYLHADQQEQDSPDNNEPSSKPVVYAQRFRLCDPLKTMQRLYLEEQDPDGLLNLVATVRQRGFDLDSKNWNYHVQALARLKKWREAFTVCEKVLMPQWTGWYAVRAQGRSKNQVPLELRRAGANPHRPRPIAHTLLVLAKEYMDLEQMMLWSHQASREFKFINESCPKTVRAVTSMHRSGSRLEAQIFGEGRRRGLEEANLGETEKKSLEAGEGEVEEGEGEGEGEDRGDGEGQGGLGMEGERKKKPEMSWRGGRHVQPEVKRRVRTRRNIAWTEGGFLNVGDAAPEGKEQMSEEDIVSALRAEGGSSGSSGEGV
ncbi:hypothetical protein NEMBOFW57_007341 [Staphylotrichum longicolle]|uniref:CoxI translation protein CYA5 n=1 Tax=Staphylotrichum longicolle TaxID=669026 RepID=A0AAD4EVB8_9PEZI|nr:hypothetical protein NEMBOFW57_007341 [Staphylotrichum longicolle]